MSITNNVIAIISKSFFLMVITFAGFTAQAQQVQDHSLTSSNAQALAAKQDHSSGMVLTLDETISIALRQSPDALTAMHRFKSSYWQYRNYKASLMPMLALDATIPSLNKGIEKYTSSEGDYFYKRNSADYNAGLSLTKNLGLTGGQLSLNSRLYRLDNFIMESDSSTSFRSTPLNISLRQPLFGYNQFRWLKKTEPLRYNEAERTYLEDLEQVSISAASAFFNLLDAQIRLKIQQTNLANNDTLYKIAKGRFNIGTIAENELLQIELSFLNARSAVEEANLTVEMRTFDLRSFLRLPEDEALILQAPQAPPLTQVEAQTAISHARKNRADALAFERRVIEAEGLVNKAKAENRFSIDLYAEYGLTQSNYDWQDVYRNPQDHQVLEVGINVPILDWGLAKSKVKLAESEMEIERTSVQQGIKDFDQEVFIKVMQYNMQPSQYAIAAKSDTIALKRYEVTKQRYLIGKIGITDLNIAQTEKDNAQQGYVSALSTYWLSYFQLRKLTLYDFVNNRPIIFNIDNIPDIN